MGRCAIDRVNQPTDGNIADSDSRPRALSHNVPDMSSVSLKQSVTQTLGPNHTSSYYAASANPTPERPALQHDISADVCIVGAGFTGLSTALHLAELGQSVVVLEGARAGWGASGRNGGQIVNGFNAGLDGVKKRFGEQTARFLGEQVQDGARVIRRFIADYNIQCDLKPLNLYAAFNTRQMQALRDKQALWKSYGMDDHEILDAHTIQDHVRTERYVGGMLDRSGGHLHPLNLALGEAAAFEKLGGIVHEQTRVINVDNIDNDPVVITENGKVRCEKLVLCGNAYLGSSVPELSARVLPVSTQVMATEPLSDDLAQSILPSDACIEDVRYILDYYRLSADKRLLFGGGTVYGGKDPADVEAKLRPNMEALFPQLKSIGVDYAWSGNFALSFTRVPQMGQLGPNTFHAMGYSGHGVTGSHLFGKVLADALCGDTDAFSRFAQIPWRPFPGGQRFRAPYSTVGSWWYGFKDRVGL